uniref:F-box domain-containing protein n=1 Tax=Caenorhabditis tropicalis TaxID=1561998 RepID=A0A1I7TBI1_9PELO
MTIPLQKLPYLAFEEVLSTIGLREKFILAALSKKTANLVKKCVFFQRFRLEIDFDNWAIALESDSLPETDDTRFSSEEYQIHLTIFKVVEFIVKVFKISRASIQTDVDFEMFNNYMVLFERYGVNASRVEAQCTEASIQDFLKISKEVPHVSVDLIPLGSPSFDKNVFYHFEFIRIKFCNPIHLKWHKDLLFSLINCKNVEIEWTDKQLDSESVILYTIDLQDFLKRWISGSKIESLQMRGFDSTKFPAIFDSLRLSYSPWRPLRFDDNDGFMIRQVRNGPKAIVYRSGDTVFLKTVQIDLS